jgi:hypothetical protein
MIFLSRDLPSVQTRDLPSGQTRLRRHLWLLRARQSWNPTLAAYPSTLRPRAGDPGARGWGTPRVVTGTEKNRRSLDFLPQHAQIARWGPAAPFFRGLFSARPGKSYS